VFEFTQKMCSNDLLTYFTIVSRATGRARHASAVTAKRVQCPRRNCLKCAHCATGLDALPVAF
jgi:hypothetical protein